ncbi:MAG: MXAN_6640 family putative metalloprotease [candidate division WOR-3 bacterium]
MGNKLKRQSFYFPLIIFLQLIFVIRLFAESDTKCGTQEALETFRYGIKLPRPASGPKYVYSTHFIIHFDTTGSNATTRAYAESTSKYAEYSWAKQCDTLLWATPPPDGAGPDDRYDIYIRNLSYLGVTYSEYLYPNPYPNGATSYIEVDNDISPWGLLQVTVAHEFNHACQLRYSYLEGVWFMENCATWMEDICYDNVNDYINYLSYSTPDPLENPHLSITETNNLYEYAGCLWPMLLQEGYNIACPRRAWERMGTVSGENTLSGIDYALSNYYGSNLAGALKKYGIWRYFTGTRADPTYHFSESNLWPTSTVLATHNSYPASGNQGSMNPSGPGGTDFIRFNPGSGILNISFNGQNGYSWGAYAIGYRVPAQSVEQEIMLDANGDGSTSMPWTGNSHIALIPIVTHWTSSANNLTFTYNATQSSLTTDVGVTAILAPTGTQDSGAVVTPQARVKNFGTNPASFSTTFRIGSFYSNTQNVNNLIPGESIIVSFTACTLRIRGTHTTRCTTALAGDQNPNNDALSGSVSVRVVDVACLAIIAPTGTIDSGTTVTPIAQVRNNGTGTVNFSATFRIGTFYNNTRSKTLEPGITDTIRFSPWTANQVGTHLTRCTTNLTGDMVPSNDAVSGSVTVQPGAIADVGVTRIIAPTGTIDSGIAVTPQAMVKNFGNVPESFFVTFRIGSFYTNTQNVNNLLPGESISVNFADWLATTRGTHLTKCTTALAGDINHTNDAISDSVFVRVFDVGIIRILTPLGTIDSGAVITPQVTVKNFGNRPASFPVTFQIGSFYSDNQNISNLNPSESTIVSFTPYTLQIRGNHSTRCTTALAGDQNPNNDMQEGSVFVLACDVAILSILAPSGTVGLGTLVVPSVRVSNNGVNPETFPVYFRIVATDTIYYDDTIITLEAKKDTIINFNAWATSNPGFYTTFAYVELAFDQISENNSLTGRFSVNEIGWQRMADLPIIPSGKSAKNGSCITGLNGKIYCLKANNTSDFYCFTPNSGIGTWTPLTALPLGIDGKNPKKGAAITGYNDKIYVLRGNNTPDFWEYANNNWRPLKNIPTGAKSPKGGSGLTYVNKADTACIFAMKGSKTQEFYLYFITTDNWRQIASPPTGTSGKSGYKDGSCLAYDGDSFVYVLKGNYGDFFRYNVLRNTWTELRPLNPAVFVNREGKKKKVKDGAGLIYLSGAVYLMKGGNTLEFWKYDVSRNDWQQMNPATIWDIPIGGGKKVKSGGSLCLLDNNIYALKGNNTVEFYKHLPPITATVSIASGSLHTTQDSLLDKNCFDDFKISASPNPVSNILTITYNSPNSEIRHLRLYNIAGTLVESYTHSTTRGNNLIQIDMKNLPAGVYILRFNAGQKTFVTKLVLER